MAKYKYLEYKVNQAPNFKNIPVNLFKATRQGAEEFNEVYFKIKNDNDFNKLIRTPSGAISWEGMNKYKNSYAYDVRVLKSCIELTVVTFERAYRYQFRYIQREANEDGKKHLFGNKAFKIFSAKLAENGININDYAIENGEEIKKTIEAPSIRMERELYKNVTFENACHVDFHNSYPAGLANTHPEFRSTIEYFYNNRKNNQDYKDVLNLTVGYMQSSMPQVKAKWSHLSRDAIHDNNERVKRLAEKLSNKGFLIIAYNTDGIWVSGDWRKFKDNNYGSKLGQWSWDHVDCKIRFRSAGSYEFIENGKYTPVVRGTTKLDELKDRKNWEWGDIYSTASNPIYFTFDEEEGIKIHYTV